MAYCAVGYRSSLLIEQLFEHLEKTGQGDTKFLELYNLEGAIFKWANEGRDLEQPGAAKKTAVVHPYNAVWGKILDAKLRSYEPN